MDQGQNITLRIAGKDYALKAATPALEQLMRLAAEDINARLAKYNETFPTASLEDKLAFVTLNETVGRLNTQRKLAAVSDEIAALKGDTDAYLSGIGK